jgi:hypothetical protein
LEGIRKEIVILLFKVPSQNLLRGTKEAYKRQAE